MRLRNGFILLEAVLYSAIILMSVGFFVLTLRAYVGWQKRAQTTLSGLLYHCRILAILQKDLLQARSCISNKGSLTIKSVYLDEAWREILQTVKYTCRKTGLYRSQETTDVYGTQQKNTLRLGPSPSVLNCASEGDGYGLRYQIEGEQPFFIQVIPLCTKK